MKTALITGGSRGIGRACVEAFSEAGYQTAFLYCHNREAAMDTQAQCGALAICCDVRDQAAVNAAKKEVLDCFHHVDVLVNNAGIALQNLFTDIEPAEWDDMLNTHLSGAYRISRAFVPGMVSRKYGRIINIGSIWGQVGASCEVHYSAAKAGLIGLTKALAKELAPSGITVNCVCPGVIETDMIACFPPETLQELASETPVGRLGTPRDVARCVLFLAEEGSSFITGQVIGVNGGFGE